MINIYLCLQISWCTLNTLHHWLVSKLLWADAIIQFVDALFKFYGCGSWGMETVTNLSMVSSSVSLQTHHLAPVAKFLTTDFPVSLHTENTVVLTYTDNKNVHIDKKWILCKSSPEALS